MSVEGFDGDGLWVNVFLCKHMVGSRTLGKMLIN